jgi:hypothetical protein
VIHNGTDAVADEHVIRVGHPVVIVLGRLVPQKRVEIAMHAVRDLAADHPGVELWVVGSGYWDTELHRVADELGIRDRVTFTGHVSEAEKHRLLAEAWVLALPSHKEGWGLVVVEAGVHGTPTVAIADVGGLNDSVHDGETGVLVHGGQAEFTAGLGALLDDDDRRAQMSERVVRWVTRFRWSDTVTRWESLLYAVAEHSKADHRPGGSSPLRTRVGSGAVVVDDRRVVRRGRRREGGGATKDGEKGKDSAGHQGGDAAHSRTHGRNPTSEFACVCDFAASRAERP